MESRSAAFKLLTSTIAGLFVVLCGVQLTLLMITLIRELTRAGRWGVVIVLSWFIVSAGIYFLNKEEALDVE